MSRDAPSRNLWPPHLFPVPPLLDVIKHFISIQLSYTLTSARSLAHSSRSHPTPRKLTSQIPF